MKDDDSKHTCTNYQSLRDIRIRTGFLAKVEKVETCRVWEVEEVIILGKPFNINYSFFLHFTRHHSAAE